MSQNTRKQPGEQGNSGRRSGAQNERLQFEGFEGMNYEQRREPFHHPKAGNQERETREGRKEPNQDQS